jgi:elongation of very long chain fatty acids protein 4
MRGTDATNFSGSFYFTRALLHLQVYNIYMVLMSLWMGVEMYGNMIKTDTFFWNRHMDRSPAGAPLAYAVWVNYISKPTEYFDTLFFLLRGNLRQVSFLHVSHHAVMPVMIASAVLEYPGGNSAFGPGLNSFVHVFMYLYYLLTGLGISMPLFIKKSITVIQLVQFGLISCQALYLLADGYFKYWNTKLGWMAIFLMVQMFSLFGNFFRTAYGGAKAKKVEKKNE